MSGRGADELAGLLGKQLGDRACVAPLERLAGQDDGAAVDRLALDPGVGVAVADETAEIVDVNGVVGAVGRKQDRRLPQDVPLDDENGSTAVERRCRCTRANIRCEVDEPMSIPTVVSSTLSAAQATSLTATSSGLT